MLNRPKQKKSPSAVYQRVYEVVQKIPHGKVTTYGAISKMAKTSGPRQVGYALHALPEKLVIPWHRVVNAKGEVSPRARSDGHEVQKLLLEAEGVDFNGKNRINLKVYAWRPKTRLTR